MVSKLTFEDLKYCVKLSYSFVPIPIQILDNNKNILMSLPNNKVMQKFNPSHELFDLLFTKEENNIHVEPYKDICIYASIRCTIENETYYIIIGPTLNDNLNFPQKMSLLTFFNDTNFEELQEFFNYVPNTDFSHLNITLKYFAFVLFNQKIHTANIIGLTVQEDPLKEDIEEIHLYSRIDNMHYHTNLSDWYNLYDIVKSSDVDGLKNYLDTPRPGKPGKLSNTPLQQKKYEAANTLFFLMPALVEKGIAYEVAVNLMDSSILAVDNCKNELEVGKTREKAYYEYTIKQSIAKKQVEYSKNIHKAIDYILENITINVTIKDIASELSISPRKLSEMFRKETGISITDYIQKQKIKAAKNLLKYTNDSYSDISNYLNFSSQSYFIQVFSKYENMTPKQYRDNFEN